jgi:hypothetical protein
MAEEGGDKKLVALEKPYDQEGKKQAKDKEKLEKVTKVGFSQPVKEDLEEWDDDDEDPHLKDKMKKNIAEKEKMGVKW